MELDELHVLQRKARAQHHAAAVAGAGMGGRRRKIGTARTAGRKDHGVRAEAVDSAVFHAERDHALALAILHDQVEREILDVEVGVIRSEEHTSELQSLMRKSYAVFCLKTKNKHK